MNLKNDFLSDLIIYLKYSNFIKKENRKETWDEIVLRNYTMHIRKFPHLEKIILEKYKFVLDKKILPAMRSLQFAGKPIELFPNKLYNCCYLPVDSLESFNEILFLLLNGSGVGFSVQEHHINKLPFINKPHKINGEYKKRRFLINDSIEGWSDAIKTLLKSFFGKTTTLPDFDFRQIGENEDYNDDYTYIINDKKIFENSSKSEPLERCLFDIRLILERKENGERLSSLECHDIICHIAKAVLGSGLRRAALISLFSYGDDEMLYCKNGNWWEKNPQRSFANNSVVLLRHKINEKEFKEIFKIVKNNNTGEPGIYLSNDKDMGTNPCAEIGLKPYQFCNLCEVNVSNIKDYEDIKERIDAACFIGTLQATYTNFHYLRPIWKKTTEDERLLGIGLTGICSDKNDYFNDDSLAKYAVEKNKEYAKLFDIKPANRVTCIKPSGTTSLVFNTSSGIHSWFNDYYVRRVRIDKTEGIYNYLKNNNSKCLVEDLFNPKGAIIEIPVKAPSNCILRTENALDFLERIKKYNINWIKPGHIKGSNTHNISATIFVKENEWDEVIEWMWLNREYYNGLSLLPYDNGSYVQAPHENITEEEYFNMLENIKDINFQSITEYNESKNLLFEYACVGNNCELK